MANCDTSPIREQIIDAIKTVEDPEIPVNLYDLGLIYDLQITPSADESASPECVDVSITMTLTTPNCPVAETMPMQVQEVVKQIAGVRKAIIKLVWTPTWTRDCMSEEGKMILEFMGITWKDPKVGPMGDLGQPSTQNAPTNLTIGDSNRGE